ncbi:MAG: hypothetical protein KME52_31920 [Desmonostoc geniculatum HA4340-LM1]|nr:hypothetical protein [Desmonostoc geniculatum HA4340-LM1]
MTTIHLALTTLKRFRTATAHSTILVLSYTTVNFTSAIAKLNHNDKVFQEFLYFCNSTDRSHYV